MPTYSRQRPVKAFVNLTEEQIEVIASAMKDILEKRKVKD